MADGSTSPTPATCNTTEPLPDRRTLSTRPEISTGTRVPSATMAEMADMMSASRAFETNVEVLGRIKSMQASLLKLGEL